MVNDPFTRRTALRGLVSGAAALTATKVLGSEVSRFRASRTSTTRTATGTAGTATPAAVPRTAALAGSVSWPSGFGDDKTVNVTGGGLATWRGEPVTYARIWADASLKQMAGVGMLDNFKLTGWAGTLDIACGGPRDGITWAAAATGAMDSTWQNTCRKVFGSWGNLTAVHLSMSHELNGNWYPWAVNSTCLADFQTSWIRWYNVVQTELVAKGKNAKVCLSLNSDTSSGVSMLSLIPPLQYVDLIGCDFYSMWPDLTTQTLWDKNLLTKKSDGAPRGVQSWFDYARSIGKSLSFPEWGLNSQQLSDNPFFITAMHDIFAVNADVLAGEAYFNANDRCRLWPTTYAPTAAARYQSTTFGVTP